MINTPTPTSANPTDPELTPDAEAALLAARGPRAPSLTRRTARGFAWLMCQTAGERVVSAAGQVALAWLLSPQDYKLIALVYTVTTFTSLFQQAGLSQVLVQRHDGFRRWATPVFWMGLTFGLGAAILTAVLAGPVAAFYHQPGLTGLLLVASLTLPLSGLNIVPDAALRAAMRFKLLAMTGLGATTVAMALSVLLARLHLGAYAFVVPQPIVMIGRSIVLWSVARPPVRRRLHLRRWRLLIGDSGMLLVASLAMMTTYVGDWIVLGRAFPDLPYVGLYFFALSLADQANRALVVNLSGVLFPALRTLKDDPSRQTIAFLKAARTLSLVGVPVCLLQSVLAGPLFRLVFPADKHAAIGVFAVISLAMIGRQLFGPSESMLLAQRRQLPYLTITLIYAPCFVVGAILGAHWGQALGVAVSVSIGANILGPLTMLAAVAPAGGGWRDVARVVGVPLLASAVSIGPAALLRLVLPESTLGDGAAVVIISALSPPLYALAVRALAREDYDMLVAKLGALARRFIPALSPPGAPPPPTGEASPTGPSRSRTTAAGD